MWKAVTEDAKHLLESVDDMHRLVKSTDEEILFLANNPNSDLKRIAKLVVDCIVSTINTLQTALATDKEVVALCHQLGSLRLL